GAPPAPARRALETFTAPTMRMQRLTLASGAVVLNDCYNANPGSMAAALQTPGPDPAARRVAVLGEIARPPRGCPGRAARAVRVGRASAPRARRARAGSAGRRGLPDGHARGARPR